MDTIDRIGSVFLRQVLRRMKQLGLNQSALSRRMKVSRPYISKVLRRDVNISFATAAKLARALQMDFFPELRPQSEVPSAICQGSADTKFAAVATSKTLRSLDPVSLAAARSNQYKVGWRNRPRAFGTLLSSAGADVFRRCGRRPDARDVRR